MRKSFFFKFCLEPRKYLGKKIERYQEKKIERKNGKKENLEENKI